MYIDTSMFKNIAIIFRQPMIPENDCFLLFYGMMRFAAESFFLFFGRYSFF